MQLAAPTPCVLPTYTVLSTLEEIVKATTLDQDAITIPPLALDLPRGHSSMDLVKGQVKKLAD